MIPTPKRVLVVVAHPDDEVLGAGGTIRRWVNQGVNVNLLVVTDGVSAQFGDDASARRRRMMHTEKACEILGIETLRVLEFPDMRLDTVPHIEVNRAMATVVEELEADTILTHHPGDVNLDHLYAFNSVMVVARPQPGSVVQTVATFAVNSSTEWGAKPLAPPFIPNLFIDITETVDRKMEAMAAYEDEIRQWPHPRSLRAVRARAEVVGSEVGVSFAEAFFVVRGVSGCT